MEILFVYRCAEALYDCDAEDELLVSFYKGKILYNSKLLSLLLISYSLLTVISS